MSDAPIILHSGQGEPDACVIWLHGLGADGHDFEPIVPELRLPPELSIRFIFPHAPMMPVTINNGYVMRAWYDILAMDIGSAQDEAGIRASQAVVEGLIEQQIAAGIASERIVLAGFSQGGAIILQAGLRFERPLAGLIALSTYLPLAQTLEAERSEANRQVPIFMAHGDSDPVVRPELAYRSRSRLEQQGYPLEWHEYRGMEHSVNLEEIRDISRWLQGRLG
jgi:phospholipase/carboxylesterase